ncbi:MAG: hypothetical protein JSS34_00715 [Proteobacteria bacterium]|nr:hypothetical protein [Pseudomonadota bacterium]
MKSSLCRFALISLLSLSAGAQNLYALQSESLHTPKPNNLSDAPSEFFVPTADSLSNKDINQDRTVLRQNPRPPILSSDPTPSNTSNVSSSQASLRSDQEKLINFSERVIAALKEKRIISLDSSLQNQETIDVINSQLFNLYHRNGTFSPLENAIMVFTKIDRAAKAHHLELSGPFITYCFEVVHLEHRSLAPINLIEIESILDKTAAKFKVLSQDLRPKITRAFLNKNIIFQSSSFQNQQIVDTVMLHMMNIQLHTGKLPSLEMVTKIVKEMKIASKARPLVFCGPLINYLFEKLRQADLGPHEVLSASEIREVLNKAVSEMRILHENPLLINPSLTKKITEALSKDNILPMTPDYSSKRKEIIQAIILHMLNVQGQSGHLPSLENVMRIIKEMSTTAKEQHLEFSGQMIAYFFEVLHASGHGPHDALSPSELQNTLTHAAHEMKALKNEFENETHQIAKIKYEFALNLMYKALSQDQVLSLAQLRTETNRSLDPAIEILSKHHVPINIETVALIHSIEETYKSSPKEQKTKIDETVGIIKSLTRKLQTIYKDESLPKGSLEHAYDLYSEGLPIYLITKTSLHPNYFPIWRTRTLAQQEAVSTNLVKLGENSTLTLKDKELLSVVEERYHNSGLSQDDIPAEIAKTISLLRKEKVSTQQTNDIIDEIRKASSSTLKNLAQFVSIRLRTSSHSNGQPYIYDKVPIIHGAPVLKNERLGYTAGQPSSHLPQGQKVNPRAATSSHPKTTIRSASTRKQDSLKPSRSQRQEPSSEREKETRSIK